MLRIKGKKCKWFITNLGESVCELVHTAMKQVEQGLKDVGFLEEFGEKMEKLGAELEYTIKTSGLEDLGERIEKKIVRINERLKQHKVKYNEEEREQIKKRIEGLVELKNSIPIIKLSQALGVPKEEAENLIYELAAEGIEGSLEEDIFKFTSPSNEVISKINELIGKM